MKKLVQNALVPFAIFTGVLVLIGCEPATTPENNQLDANSSEQSISATDTQNAPSSTTQNSTPLKSGNMFYIVRDVADMQLKAGSYVEQLKQTQSDIETAVSSQDPIQLQKAADQLQQQLKGFNQALSGLNLKSTEINDIRSNLQAANQQVLASPFLNGQMDLTQVDIQKIKNQMGNIQLEMVKLASMIISDHSAQEKTSES
ncbi:hypothetical protein F7P75_14420 [Acinetobacter gandensis]|uniref:Lipoprotein n=1 Tax=Acinetobacter gandensis TaxID=1443941 RepID=A0A1A7RFE9_9GAMM|nr:hypothetical protein [Acinetobacter gandensis]KAB0622898.1 hypothetical protein F7P75_14420 [Acinetobacter gandensis]OBX29397.1 hypothetical protein A9J31_13845 [Acinetobacter gandensis]